VAAIATERPQRNLREHQRHRCEQPVHRREHDDGGENAERAAGGPGQIVPSRRQCLHDDARAQRGQDEQAGVEGAAVQGMAGGTMLTNRDVRGQNGDDQDPVTR
jgi:hypothetical protein